MPGIFCLSANLKVLVIEAKYFGFFHYRSMIKLSASGLCWRNDVLNEVRIIFKGFQQALGAISRTFFLSKLVLETEATITFSSLRADP